MLYLLAAFETPQVYVIPSTINTLLQIIVTIVLFLVLRHFLFKPVTEFMQKRSALVKEEVEEAKQHKKDALDLKEDYQARIDQAKKEAQAILEEGRKRGYEMQEEIVTEAKGKSEAMLQKAREEIDREREKARDDIKQELVELSVMMASKIMEKELDANTHRDMIHSFVDELGDEKWQS
jgi:F-type H+-transporting ATPase subunit b